MSSRFIVTEIEGYLDAESRGTHPGLSVMVLDRARCHQVVATWRTEDYRRAGNVAPRDQVRIRARSYCAALNEGRTPPRVGMYRSRHHGGAVKVTEH